MKRRFETLVDAHGARLLQLARGLLRRHDEAEDVVQETLVKLWHALPELEPKREPGWLVTCTRNACLDLLRRRQRGRAMLHVVAAADYGGESDPAESPEQRLSSDERAQTLHAAIAELPEPGRSLLILRDIHQLDVATVAGLLSLTENQVKVYTFRARRALKCRLEEEQHEPRRSEHVA